jgi:hypothetical protein
MTFHTVQLKKKTFELLPTAKKEFLQHHPEWEVEMLSNNKIIFESIRYYIGTGKFKGELKK